MSLAKGKVKGRTGSWSRLHRLALVVTATCTAPCALTWIPSTLPQSSRSDTGPKRIGLYASEKETSQKRGPWDVVRFVQTASFFGAVPNPLDIFRSRGRTRSFSAVQTLWSETKKDLLEWGSLDDVVMGGASRSNIKGNTWSGTVITDGGGFAGIRTKSLEPAFDFINCKGLRLRVREGGGQRYKLIIRDAYDWNGIAWSYSFDTKTILPGQMVEIMAPFNQFVPTLYARTVPFAKLNKSQITAIQITLSKFEYDGKLNPFFQAGDFTIVLDSLETF